MMNRFFYFAPLALLVLCTAALVYMRPPAGPTLGVSAILVAERCGRIWVIHEDGGRSDFRMVHVPSAFEAELEACENAGPRVAIEMCGRRWTITPTAPGRALATRMVPEGPFDEDGCL